MRTLILVGLCLSQLLVVGVARADLSVGTYAPDVEGKEWLYTEEPISLSDLRGMVVVLFFWVSFHAGGENVMETMNVVGTNPNIGRGAGVYVIGVTDADRARVEETLEKEKFFFPVALESKSAEDYRVESFPRVVLIDPDGKVAWTGWPGNANALVTEVQKLLANNPPRKTHPEEAVQARKALGDARDAIRAEKYHDAFEAARDAYEHALRGDPLKSRCQDMLDLVEAIGKDEVASVDKLMADKQYAEVVRTLRLVARQFRGLDISKTAKERLEALKKQHTQIADILRSQQSEAEARGLLVRAREDILGRRFGPGYSKLETILTDYASTEVAVDARDVKRRMEENATVMAEVRDFKAARECNSLMAQARSYVQLGRSDEAKRIYRQIIEKHPNTSFADQAARELVTLP